MTGASMGSEATAVATPKLLCTLAFAWRCIGEVLDCKRGKLIAAPAQHFDPSRLLQAASLGGYVGLVGARSVMQGVPIDHFLEGRTRQFCNGIEQGLVCTEVVIGFELAALQAPKSVGLQSAHW